MLTNTYRFTVADFYRMAETGILREDARVELLEGEIIPMMPIGEFHASVVDDLNDMFGKQNRDRFQLRVQNPLQLSEHSMVQPDVILLQPRKDRYRTSAPGPDDALLVIEVADSSLAFDQREKLPLYARAGVEEVWIVNIPERQVEVYREPNFLEYVQTEILRTGKECRPAAFADISIPVAELFD
jgi:Uma2 family endonuclease